MTISDKISILNNVNNINNKIEKIGEKVQTKTDKVSGGKESFKSLLQGFVGDVNKLQTEADESVNKLASGEITDMHDVMVKVEEANLSFSLMMELRNKIIEGYKEVIRTQV